MWAVRLREVRPDGDVHVCNVVVRDAETVRRFWRAWCRLSGLPVGALDRYPDTIVGVLEENGRTVSMIADQTVTKE